MKQSLWLILSLVLAAVLAGCSPSSPLPEPAPAPKQAGDQESPSSTITDISEPSVGLHEELIEQTFAEGEDIDNLFYRRSVNGEGAPAYAVTRKSDGQTVYLPMNETVLYVTKTGPSYYEKVTVTYMVNGGPSSIEQYELYVQSTDAEAEPLSPEDHPDISVADVAGETTPPDTAAMLGNGTQSLSGAQK